MDKIKAALIEGHLILIRRFDMSNIEELNQYLQTLLFDYTGVDLNLQILEPNKLSKRQAMTLGYMIERMQRNDFGDQDKLETIRLYVLQEFGKAAHEEKLKPGLKLTVESATDPENPGVYVFAEIARDIGTTELGCVLIELNEGKLMARVWDDENQGRDPVSIELYDLAKEKE